MTNPAQEFFDSLTGSRQEITDELNATVATYRKREFVLILLMAAIIFLTLYLT